MIVVVYSIFPGISYWIFFNLFFCLRPTAMMEASRYRYAFIRIARLKKKGFFRIIVSHPVWPFSYERSWTSLHIQSIWIPQSLTKNQLPSKCKTGRIERDLTGWGIIYFPNDQRKEFHDHDRYRTNFRPIYNYLEQISTGIKIPVYPSLVSRKPFSAAFIYSGATFSLFRPTRPTH